MCNRMSVSTYMRYQDATWPRWMRGVFVSALYHCSYGGDEHNRVGTKEFFAVPRQMLWCLLIDQNIPGLAQMVERQTVVG
jgi:hypothetical protein